MKRIVYLNGSYLPEQEARVSIFDRGFLMADSVYEVTAVLNRNLIDFFGHMRRLERSLAELQIGCPLDAQQWLTIHRELVERNQLDFGIVYLQVTRGNPGDRDFKFPDDATPPTWMAFTQSKPDLINPIDLHTGWKVITLPDLRWGRCDIKTTQLLYSSMSKTAANRAGAHDAWFVKDGWVTEGTSNNAYIVMGKQLITRQLGDEILHGITRQAVVQFAAEAGLEVLQRPFSISEAQLADEAFVTSATAFVMPIVEIDGKPVGNGQPGARTCALREIYLAHMQQSAI